MDEAALEDVLGAQCLDARGEAPVGKQVWRGCCAARSRGQRWTSSRRMLLWITLFLISWSTPHPVSGRKPVKPEDVRCDVMTTGAFATGLPAVELREFVPLLKASQSNPLAALGP